MMMGDMDNRWVYKGSVTTPPCDTFVYWNVVRRVYPLKQRHLDLFYNQLERGNLQKTGNYRETQALDDHDPYVISTELPRLIDINLNDKLKLSNTKDGQVKVLYNSQDGSNSAFNPKLDGSFEVTYKDAHDRTFSYTRNGKDHFVDLCGWLGSGLRIGNDSGSGAAH
jgi:hypothetical protein